MKLDRNINPDGRGKYALIKLRLSTINRHLVDAAKAAEHDVLVEPDAIDFGNTADSDFFVIRIKDKYAAAALDAYAVAATKDDPEYANQIAELAQQAMDHQNKRRPD